ncbi:MAG: ABC transporter permease [Bacteroidia bacterium]
MGKIGIIIVREYLTRVKNKTFIIMCFVAPVLFAALMIVPAMLSSIPSDPRTIVVVDGVSECGQIFNYEKMFRDTLNLHFDLRFTDKQLDETKKLFADSSQTSVLYIPKNFMGACDTTSGYNVQVNLFSQNEPGQQTINHLSSVFSATYRQWILSQDTTVSVDMLERAKQQVSVTSKVKGVISNGEIKAFVGLAFGMVIYLYVLLFGVQVMRSVLEEKTTRIVEVIISSVKPFQLMMGKILATMMAGLTQFLIWAILTFAIIGPVISKVNDKRLDVTQAQLNPTAIAPGSGAATDALPIKVDENVEKAIDTIGSINWSLLIGSFLFYFVFGYLMYASLFAAVGAASDTETDTQQFSMPLTIPLIIGIASFGLLINNPNGIAMKWLSQIPFTSPIVMLMRLPYNNVSVAELLLSMFILVVSFLLLTMLASRIYRVGILMYGKKTSWRELARWMFWRG